MNANRIAMDAADGLAGNFLVRATAVVAQQELVRGERDRLADGGRIVTLAEGDRDRFRRFFRCA